MHEERALLEEAIAKLERLALGGKKRRGRPPVWLSRIQPKRPGRPSGSRNKKPDEIPPV